MENTLTYLSYIAKALSAVGGAFLSGVVLYNVDVNPLVLVGVSALIAGLAVFIVPNGEKPE